MTHAGKYIDQQKEMIRSMAQQCHDLRMERDKLTFENKQLRAEIEKLKRAIQTRDREIEKLKLLMEYSA